MDEHVTIEHAVEPKKITRSQRRTQSFRRVREQLLLLEELSQDLLRLLERATRPGLSEPERQRLHAMAANIRANLEPASEGSAHQEETKNAD